MIADSHHNMAAFPPWHVMIAIDLSLILFGLILAAYIYKKYWKLEDNTALLGFVLLFVGYWCFTAPYVYDLISMTILPVVIGEERAMAEMNWARITFSWYVSLAGGLIACMGMAIILRASTRQSEQLRLAKDAAEAASLAKSSFLANMSHELRTPMNGVLGMADILSRTQLNDNQHSHVNTIRKSGEALLAIVNDILDLAKIEADQLTVDTHKFRVSELLAFIETFWRPLADEKGLSLSIVNKLIDIDRIVSDNRRLQQIINNLLSNAIKFTENGYVILTVDSKRKEGEWVELLFEVQDSGIGIAPDKQSRILRPFIQAEHSTSRHFGGTGLGLSICQHLVHLLGGTLQIESKPGQGTIVGFAVRVQTAATETKETFDAEASLSSARQSMSAQMPQAMDQDNLRILLVEDNVANQDVAKGMLMSLDCAIDVVENGVEAVAAVERGAYDVILMDVQMPKMDGVAATKQIRRLPEPKGNVPIIAMTAYAMVEDREQYFAAGMNDYVSKPIFREQLVGAIKRCVDAA